MKKPRPSPAGPKKSLYAAVSRTRKLFGSPAQGGPNKFGAPHTGRLIETEHDNHSKELRTVRNSRALNAMPIAFAAYFRQFNLVAHAATAAIHLTLADRTAHDCVPFHNCRGVRPWPEKGTVKLPPGNYRRRGPLRKRLRLGYRSSSAVVLAGASYVRSHLSNNCSPTGSRPVRVKRDWSR